ncbi:MAG: metallophosphoesterase [Melioribacteraceae bacterium]|nr:metallophosphoesterase [Melioribacteraceae bacterium]
MRQTPYIALMIFSLIILLIDFYSYKGLKKIKLNLNSSTKKVFSILFWTIPLLIIATLFFLFTFREKADPRYAMVYFHYFSGSFLLLYIPKLLFVLFNLFDDLFHFGKYLVLKINKAKLNNSEGDKISRSTFLTRVGFVIAGIPFLSIAYGIGWGRFNFIIRKSNLYYSNLPKEFNGFKIAQISDFHLGSYAGNIDKVEEVVNLINEHNPDLIVFTGDLVNNLASEIEPYLPVLSKLKAKYGMYSILGNHDYGEYVRWSSPVKKRENIEQLIKNEEEIGFEMLMNSAAKITIGKSSISIIGVENWGLPPFPQYGNLNKALQNIDDSEFKILLSHDPTHWDAEVVSKTNIDLTLSGHTHGAQFGIEIPGWRWSPVNLRYKQWGGVYRNGKQVLNVNTGIGFIGFPGRIGMPPEVGLITLKNSNTKIIKSGFL